MQSKLCRHESVYRKLSSEYQRLSSEHRTLSSDHTQLVSHYEKLSSKHGRLLSQYNELSVDLEELPKRVQVLENELSIVKRENDELHGLKRQMRDSRPKEDSLSGMMSQIYLPQVEQAPWLTNRLSDPNTEELTNIEEQIRNVQLPAQVRGFQQSRFQPSEIQRRFPK